jgi:hypothetical protein
VASKTQPKDWLAGWYEDQDVWLAATRTLDKTHEKFSISVQARRVCTADWHDDYHLTAKT